MDMILYTRFVIYPTIANGKVFRFLDLIGFKKISYLETPKIHSRVGRAIFSIISMVQATFLGIYYCL